MVRIVRIAGVAALILSGLVVASVLGPVRLLHLRSSDGAKIREFLDSPGAVERYNSQHGSVADTQDQMPPLVRQAESLATILTPRVDVSLAPKETTGETRSLRAPPTSFAQYGLVGVSYCPSDPQSCFAYIRMPDNTYEWVQPGGLIGHMVVKQVNANSITCLEGQQTREIMVEPPMDTASILETGAGSPPTASGTAVPAATGMPGLRPEFLDRTSAAANVATGVHLNEQEQKNMEALLNRMKRELPGRPMPGQADSNATSGNEAGEMGRLISEIQSARVSAEEAHKLESLGDELNGTADKQRAEEKRRELMKRLTQRRPGQ